MWYGYEEALKAYHDIMVLQWIDRGFKNNMPLLTANHYVLHSLLPHWTWDKKLHASHRSNLLRKDPEFYGRHGWKEGPDLPYYWPVTKEEVEVKRVLACCV